MCRDYSQILNRNTKQQEDLLYSLQHPSTFLFGFWEYISLGELNDVLDAFSYRHKVKPIKRESLLRNKILITVRIQAHHYPDVY